METNIFAKCYQYRIECSRLDNGSFSHDALEGLDLRVWYEFSSVSRTLNYVKCSWLSCFPSYSFFDGSRNLLGTELFVISRMNESNITSSFLDFLDWVLVSCHLVPLILSLSCYGSSSFYLVSSFWFWHQ